MSRGYGRRQRQWLDLASDRFSDFDACRLWTFSEVCRASWPELSLAEIRILRTSEMRSLRRALSKHVQEMNIIAIGSGECDPRRRYILNPALLEPDDPRRAKILGALESLGFAFGEDGILRRKCMHHQEQAA
jgi:hypothetical protein